MNVKELENVLDIVIELIAKNRESITMPILSKIQTEINILRQRQNLQAAICGFLEIDQEKLDNIFSLIDLFIQKESEILNKGLDTKVSDAMKSLKNHPLIMNTIAMLI